MSVNVRTESMSRDPTSGCLINHLGHFCRDAFRVEEVGNLLLRAAHHIRKPCLRSVDANGALNVWANCLHTSKLVVSVRRVN